MEICLVEVAVDRDRLIAVVFNMVAEDLVLMGVLEVTFWEDVDDTKVLITVDVTEPIGAPYILQNILAGVVAQTVIELPDTLR